ncbi:DUF928 domain-containing protein [Phormidesmis sp. 146-33]
MTMKILLSAAIVPLSLGFALFSSSSATAQSLKLTDAKPTLISQAFKPIKRGAPKTTAGGATRGSCLPAGRPLTALMPPGNLSLTIAPRPTFFWSVPKTTIQTAQFLLLSDNDTKIVYEATLLLPAAGIVEFTLPATAPALEVGKQYHWYLTIACSPDAPDNGLRSEGWVERTKLEPALSQVLKVSRPEQYSKIYAEAGIWHEALTVLVNQRRTNSRDSKVMDNWKKLLESVGLNQVVTQPLAGSSRPRG